MPHPAEPSNPTPLASRIREARQRAGLRPTDLAEKCATTPVTVWRWEHRNQKPSIDLLRKIAEHTHTTTDWLLGEAA